MDSDEEQVSFLEKDSGSRLTRQKSTRNVSMVGAIAPSRPKSNRKTPLNKVPFAYSNPVEKVPGDSNANGMNAIESFLLLTSTQPEDELQSHSGSVKIVEDKYRYAPQVLLLSYSLLCLIHHIYFVWLVSCREFLVLLYLLLPKGKNRL